MVVLGEFMCPFLGGTTHTQPHYLPIEIPHQKEVLSCYLGAGSPGASYADLCVLTGIWTNKYGRSMRWRGSNNQSGIDKVLDSVAYCYAIIPLLTRYYSPCRSYHKSS